MSGLEDRLRAWAAAEAAAAGEPPFVPLGALRRRAPRWGLVAAGTAFAAALSVTSVVVLGGSGGHAPAQVAQPGVVPWADLPPAALPVPGPVASTGTGQVPPCTAADLRASAPDPGQGAGGTWIAFFALTNRAPTACRLSGRLDGLSGVSGGRRQVVHVDNRGSPFAADLVPVVLDPGESGQVGYGYYKRCDGAQPATTPVFRELQLTLLGGVLPVAGGVLDLGCDSAATGVWATPLGGQPPTAVVPQPPWGALEASVTAPTSARAGAVLHFTVTLKNPSSTPVALAPCPNLLQALGGLVKDPHQLNCAASLPVPAGGEERFAMELSVPADATDGPATLVWSLYPATPAPRATAAVTITGGATVDTSAACTPGSSAPPCSAMQRGQLYPYALYTHCGVRELFADGQWWVPTAAQGTSPGPGLGDPYDHGTVTLDKPGVLLTYRSERAGWFGFRPRRAGDPAVPVCR